MPVIITSRNRSIGEIQITGSSVVIPSNDAGIFLIANEYTNSLNTLGTINYINSVINNSLSGAQFYPNSNPSGFITTGQTGAFGGGGGSVNTGVLTGVFYPLNTNPNNYATNSGVVQITGYQVILGDKSFSGSNFLFEIPSGRFYRVSAGQIISADLFASRLYDLDGDLSVDWGARYTVGIDNNTAVDWGNRDLYGEWGVSTTGTNPLLIANRGLVTLASGSLRTSINTLNSWTGISTGIFVTRAESGQFAAITNLAQTGLTLQTQINSITSATGLFITNSQTGGFATAANLASSGSNLQNQISLITAWTGISTNLYVSKTESGQFASSANLASSGLNLQTQINLINTNTGLFITSAQTGGFAAASNLTLTGSNLQIQINAINNATGNFATNVGLTNLSGFFNSSFSNVKVTGSATITTANFSGSGAVNVTYSNGIIVISSAAGGGETNTASNLGTGSGIWSQKNGVDLQFKSLKAGANLSITGSATELSINLIGDINFSGYVARFGQIGVSINNSPSEITTGEKGFFQLNHAIDLRGWRVAANTTGNLSVDILTASYNSFPVFSSIVDSPIFLSGQNKNIGVTTGWNNIIPQGNYIKFVVLSNSGINEFNLNITGLKYV